MQTTKTRFEQVPIEVAKRALRLQTGGPQSVAPGNLRLSIPRPVRARRRHLRRRFLPGLDHRNID